MELITNRPEKLWYLHTMSIRDRESTSQHRQISKVAIKKKIKLFPITIPLSCLQGTGCSSIISFHLKIGKTGMNHSFVEVKGKNNQFFLTFLLPLLHFTYKGIDEQRSVKD